MRRRGTYTRQDLLTCKASTLNPGSVFSTLRLLSPSRNSFSFRGFQAFSHRLAITSERNAELAHFSSSLPVLEILFPFRFLSTFGFRSYRNLIISFGRVFPICGFHCLTYWSPDLEDQFYQQRKVYDCARPLHFGSVDDESDSVPESVFISRRR